MYTAAQIFDPARGAFELSFDFGISFGLCLYLVMCGPTEWLGSKGGSR